MTEITCLRCGRCCYFLLDSKITKCQYLIPQKNGTTLCRIYKDRLARKLAFVNKKQYIVCKERKDSDYNYKNCPFNVLDPKKPLFGEKE